MALFRISRKNLPGCVSTLHRHCPGTSESGARLRLPLLHRSTRRVSVRCPTGCDRTPRAGFRRSRPARIRERWSCPAGIAPACLTRSTTAQSFSGTWSLNNREPSVVRTPPVIWESLIAMGSPWSGPNGSPRITAASASAARLIASSRVTSRNEWSWGSSRSMRSRNVSTSSTGDTCLDRTRFTSPSCGRSCEFLAHCDFSLVVRSDPRLVLTLPRAIA